MLSCLGRSNSAPAAEWSILFVAASPGGAWWCLGTRNPRDPHGQSWGCAGADQESSAALVLVGTAHMEGEMCVTTEVEQKFYEKN